MWRVCGAIDALQIEATRLIAGIRLATEYSVANLLERFVIDRDDRQYLVADRSLPANDVSDAMAE